MRPNSSLASASLRLRAWTRMGRLLQGHRRFVIFIKQSQAFLENLAKLWVGARCRLRRGARGRRIGPRGVAGPRRSRRRDAGSELDRLELLGRLTPHGRGLGLSEPGRLGGLRGRQRIGSRYRWLWLGSRLPLPSLHASRPDREDQGRQRPTREALIHPSDPGTYGHHGPGRGGPIPRTRHRAGSLPADVALLRYETDPV